MDVDEHSWMRIQVKNPDPADFHRVVFELDQA